MASRLISGLLIAVLLVANPFQVGDEPASATNPGRISGWLPYWEFPERVDVAVANSDLMAEASPFWFDAKQRNGVLGVSAKSQAPGPAGRALVRDRLKAAGLLVLPSITDAAPPRATAGVLADPAGRAAHVQAIVDLVMNEGYDGIDIDYEKFAFHDGRDSWPTTQPAWRQFVAELGAALRQRGKLLSITTPVIGTSKADFWVYDWQGIAPHVDRLRIMSYDYSVPNPGPIAPVNWVRQALQSAVAVIPAQKIQIGIPTYGRNWRMKVEGTCPQVPGVSSALASRVSWTAKEAWGNIEQLRATPGVEMGEVTWNPRFAERTVNYVRNFTGPGADGSETTCRIHRQVWWVDKEGYLARARLVDEFGILGSVAWTVGGEEPGTFEALRGAPAAPINPASPATPSAPAPIGGAGVALPAAPLQTREVSLNKVAGKYKLGKSVAVKGTVSPPAGLRSAGVPGTVSLKVKTAKGWVKVASVKPKSNGQFNLAFKPGSKGRKSLQVVIDAVPGWQGATSNAGSVMIW